MLNYNFRNLGLARWEDRQKLHSGKSWTSGEIFSLDFDNSDDFDLLEWFFKSLSDVFDPSLPFPKIEHKGHNWLQVSNLPHPSFPLSGLSGFCWGSILSINESRAGTPGSLRAPEGTIPRHHRLPHHLFDISWPQPSLILYKQSRVTAFGVNKFLKACQS